MTTNFQSKTGRLSYNELDHLISALNKRIQSLEKQLNEKQIVIETLLQNIQNCSCNNIVTNGNHKVDKISFENLNSTHKKPKMISVESNQVDDGNNQYNNHSQKIISETNDEHSITFDKRIDKSNSTAIGDRITKK